MNPYEKAYVIKNRLRRELNPMFKISLHIYYPFFGQVDFKFTWITKYNRLSYVYPIDMFYMKKLSIDSLIDEILYAFDSELVRYCLDRAHGRE